jgi:dynein heavy chain, axonemal
LAQVLARKMVATFKLCSEQLSSQDHYDYGMRAVKSTITACGNLKGAFPDDREDALVLRGLRDINIPKFLAPDLPLFHGIISDLFPDVPPPDVDYSALQSSLSASCASAAIQPVTPFIEKAIQLYETTLVRHGLMLVGAPMAGKTAVHRALAAAMTSLSRDPHHSDRFPPVRITALNPKAVTIGQLYGEFDRNTHEWTDGVLACHIRGAAEDTSRASKWLMFDGPVDAIWIENMNTVLDDNKKLCLVSGEIIALSSSMTMMFEVEDLSVASPATVSRCGMVYMEPAALGLDPFAESWLQGLPPGFVEVRHVLRDLFQALVPPLIGHVRKHLKETVATVDGNLCVGVFKIFGALIGDSWEVEAAPQEVERARQVAVPLFLFAIVWGVGGSCDRVSRPSFDAEMRQTLSSSRCDLQTILFAVRTVEWSRWYALHGMRRWLFDDRPSREVNGIEWMRLAIIAALTAFKLLVAMHYC